MNCKTKQKKLKTGILPSTLLYSFLLGIGAKANLYCKAIELVCGGSPKVCVLVECKARHKVKSEQWPFTKPPLLQRSRLNGRGSPNLVGLIERKAL